MGGMLGVGAGSLMVPLLIMFHVNPRVAAATSGFSKLFISAATVLLADIGILLLFILEGDISHEAILFFVSLGVAGGFILSGFIYYLVHKYKYLITIILDNNQSSIILLLDS